MTTEDYFNQDEFITSSKVPKERRRFTYFDLLKFAEYYHKSELKLLNIAGVINLGCDLLRNPDYCDNFTRNKFGCGKCNHKQPCL